MPRLWFSGPRVLGGLVRPGISFNVNELYIPEQRRKPCVCTKQPRDKSHCIFVMRAPDGRCRLGLSDDPWQYLKQRVQGSAIISFIGVVFGFGGERILKAANDKLALYIDTDGWFVLPPAVQPVSMIIQSAIELDEQIHIIKQSQIPEFLVMTRSDRVPSPTVSGILDVVAWIMVKMVMAIVATCVLMMTFALLYVVITGGSSGP